MQDKVKKNVNPKISIITEKNIRNYFFFFLILGFIVVYFSGKIVELNISIIPPIILMIIYWGVVTYKGKNVIANDQIGDSVYYLGFLLTLFALILSLIYAADNPSEQLSEVLPKFGIALITTIVGLGIRVYMTAFEVSQEDREDIASTQLTSASTNLRIQLETINEILKGTLTTLSEEIRTNLEGQSVKLAKFLDENTKEFSESSRKIIGNINNASDGLTSQTNELKSSFNTLNKALNTSKDSLSTLNNMFNQLGSSFKDLDQINLSDQLIDLNEKLKTFSINLDVQNKEITQLNHLMKDDIDFIKNHKSQLQSAVEESQRSIEMVQTNLTNLTKVIIDKIKK